jgi:hypothetical protein
MPVTKIKVSIKDTNNLVSKLCINNKEISFDSQDQVLVELDSEELS